MDFLFENPFIIVVLIGIISSLFNKAKGQSKGNPSQPKPFAESTPIPQEPSFDDFPEEPIRAFEADYNEMKKEAEKKIRALREQQKRYEERAARLNSEAVMSEPKTTAPSTGKVENASLEVDREKLADAVIWSEILGPPRSKRPHRSLNIR